ncbi:hypothetical protein ACX64N_12695 [Raoultella planticola]|uniref:hypothetical protein n=1 Tax=Raoultella planticola TaxID=575 RepID=UPI00066ABE1B|nr:hypothetical protein [Raoultella planticola]MCQ6501170.1 hypothetical protein [Raoultella planticola]TQN56001.1 hypothetical protein FLW98_09805 [Raoultella planticola]HBC8112027.1 hypothetical protein [Raoultella planticola]
MNNNGLTLNQLAERNAELVTKVEKLRAERDQLAADNVGLLNFITTRCYVFDGTWTGDMSDYYSPAEEVMPETHATSAYLAGIKADGVELFAKEMHADISVDDARKFAQQLRAGTDK